MFKRSTLTLIILLGLSTSCLANTYYYAGLTNGVWTTSSNWASFDGGTHYPGYAAGDVANINYAVNINVSSALANSLSTLTVGYATSVSITISSGITMVVTNTVTQNGPSTFTVAGAGAMTMSGGFAIGYFGSFVIGSSGVNTTVSLPANQSFNMSQNNATFTNYGTLNLASGCTWAAANSNPSITNYGTINLTKTTCSWSGNTFPVINSGYIYGYSGTAITMAGNPQSITNSGTIALDNSSLTSSGNTTPIINSGTFTLTNSASITISGGGSSPFTNSGNFSATSSTVNFTAGTGNTVTNSGTFYCSASPIAFGGGTWTLNNSGAFSALSGSNITVAGSNSVLTSTAGTFTVTSSNITFNNAPISIQNSGSSTFHASACTMDLSYGNNSYISNSSSNSFTADGVSTITLGYGAYISNSGTFYAGTSNSQCIINVNYQTGYVSNSGTNANFYLGSTSIIYMGGYQASITNGSQTGCTFTLQSDQYGSAAIGAINANASTTGTFSVQRYFQGGSSIVNGRYAYRGYRLISSPVHNSATYNGNNVYGLNYIVGLTAGHTTDANSTTNAFITGCTGGSTSAGNPSMYLYKESVVPSNASFTAGNYVGITNITNSSTTGIISTSDGTSNPSLPIGNGVLFFDRGQATNWATRTKSPYIAPEPVILTSTGLINQQSVTVKPWNNSSSSTLNYTVTGSGTGSNTNYAVRGYNLVGNPYPCSIDWNTSWSGSGITATNLSATIWVFNERTNQYDTFTTSSSAPTTGTGNATNIIASGQGFLVKGGVIPANSSSLTFTENCKAPTKQLTATTTLLMGTPAAQAVAQTLRLNMVTDSINHDDIIIGFNSGASSKFSQMEDGQYIPGNGAAEGLSSISEDGYKLAINYMPLPKQTATSIKLFVTAAASGVYTMQRTQLDGIPAIYEVWLMDKYKKDSLDIRNNTTYAFNIDLTDTASFGNNRFEVLIRQNPALGVHLLQFTATKAASGSQVTWKTENEVNYTNFTVERSNDNGTTYNVIGGFTSTAAGTYGFLDSSPLNGANLYRLKLEDLNGAITYSNVVTLMYSGTANNITINNIKVYPNPTAGTINLAITPPTGSVTSNLSALQGQGTTPSLAVTQTNSPSYGIKIIDITGSVIKTATSASASWQDNVSNLSPGTYIIQVVNNSNKSVVGKSTFVKL